ncbi:hypothetical protein [Paenibacillus soyae]|uniref:Uncharacterized protein n=1 Tax=Paenibacillus soyae TaxID=2969249 RepID=A0A9X2MTX8_9BACL|nr:hypothetical protein [Paenibacillus soyae]MCR2806754.1 hypothetical protein [Paenibacillus soyae]
MNSKLWKKVAITGITSAMFITAVPISNSLIIEAASVQETLAKQQVKLEQNVYLTIRDAQILVQEEGKLLAFTVAIKNSGTSPIDLLDYWVRVKNKSGKNYKIKLLESDKNKGTVVPGSTSYLTYYAYVDTQTKISDIKYDIVKWDFNVANYERLLGSITTPATMTGATDVNKAGSFLLSNSILSGTLKSYVATKDQVNTNATLRFEINNTSAKAVDLSKLSFYVQTSDWSVYKASASSLQTNLASKGKVIIFLNVTVPNSAITKGLTLVPAVADETSKLDIPLGVFTVPNLTATKPTAVDKSQTVVINEQNVETLVVSSDLTSSDNRQEAVIAFQLKNIGSKSVDTSNYQFLIETANGTQYPLEYIKEETTKLLPNIESELQLKGYVPNDLDLNKSKLVMKQSDSEGKNSNIIGLYALSSADLPDNTDNIYRTKDYQVDLISVNRIPDDTDDILVAQLSITNNTDKAIKIPSLSGYYLADGVQVETTTSEVSLDNSINLAPKSKHQIAVYTKIPYTAQINDVAFVLTQKLTDQSKKLYQYKGRLPETVGQSVSSPYVVDNVGRRASIHVKKASISETQGNTYFYGEFDLVNKEIRTSNVTQLGGYLEDSEGILVPVTFTAIADKVLPNGKVLYAAYGLLPTGFNAANYKMYVGQALPIGTGEQTDQLLVSPVAYNMKTQTQVLDDKMQGIEFGGYTLDITEINSDIEIENDFLYKGIKLNLKYSLAKDTSYQFVPKDQKVLVEFVDQGSAKATYSKEFTLGATGDGNLSEGADIRLPIFYADDKMMTKINSFQTYKVNIYVAFGTNKMLLASREVKWFYADRPLEDK